jgi:hypothetical protein
MEQSERERVTEKDEISFLFVSLPDQANELTMCTQMQVEFPETSQNSSPVEKMPKQATMEDQHHDNVYIDIFLFSYEEACFRVRMWKRSTAPCGHQL